MSTEHCKLAAVLFADMVGYSARQQDVALELRREMMTLTGACLAAGQGKLIKTAGDEIFAEFPSGSAAVACAMQIQEGVARRNASQPRARRFLLRAGINSGEVAMEGEDLIGGTVNVAKRAEQLAAPGGICITEHVWRDAEAGLQADFTRLGMVAVKADPPRQVFFHRYAAETGAFSRLTHQFNVRYARLGRLVSAATVLLLLGVGLRLAWPAEDPDALVSSGMKQIERFDLAGHIERAASDFKKAQKLDPSSAKALDGLAWAQWLQYHETGDTYLRGEAEKHANDALAQNTNVIFADVVLGLMAEEMGRYTNAADHLRRANDHSHWQSGALLTLLAGAERLTGGRAEALDLAQRAEAKAGQGWEVWDRFGTFWFEENDLTNSLRAFRRAANSEPKSPVSAKRAIQVLMKSGRSAEVLEEAGQFKNQDGSPEALSVYGNACLAAYENVQAYQAFKHAADLCASNYLYFGSAGLALFLAQTNAPEWTRLLKNEAVVQARAQLNDAPGNALVRANLATYEAALGEKSSGLDESERNVWNQAALADADRVFRECPFLPEIISKLKTPYYILERQDRLGQCEARLLQLKGRR